MLKTKKILVTRDVNDCKEMKSEIIHFGGEAVVLPLIEKISIKTNITKKYLSNFNAILFNSASGVKYFFEGLSEELKEFIKFDSDILIGAVGEVTATELESREMCVDIVSKKETILDLINETMNFTEVGDGILIVTSDISPLNLEKLPCKHARNFEKIAVYKTVVVHHSSQDVSKALSEADYIALMSGSTAESLVLNTKGKLGLLKDKKIVSIGPSTTEVAKSLGLKVDIEAKNHNMIGVLKAIGDD